MAAAFAVVFMQACFDGQMRSEAFHGQCYTFALEPVSGTGVNASALTEENMAWNSADCLGTYAPGAPNMRSPVTPGFPATFSVFLSHPVKAGESFCFYCPYDATAGSDPKAARLSIAASQPGDLSSLPMAALPYIATERFSTGEVIPSLRFFPLGSVLELGIYTETSAYQGETVRSVSFEAEDGIAGQFTFDLSSANTGDPSTLSISSLPAKKVTVTPVTATKVGASRIDVTPLYMVVAPGSHAGTLTIVTDKASYTYGLTTRDFVRTAIMPLAIKLTQAMRKAPCYELVTSVNEVTDGRYIVAANCDGTYYAMPGNIPINNNNKVSGTVVTVTDNVVTSDNAESMAVDVKVDEMQLTISNGTRYLSQPSVDKTDLGLSSSGFQWSYSSSGAGRIRLASTLGNSPTRCLLFRTADGRVDYYCFGAYSAGSSGHSGYYEISLFKYNSNDGSGMPVTPPEASSPTVETGYASAVSSSGATLSAIFRNTASVPRELRFEYGMSASDLSWTSYYNDVVPTDGVAYEVTLTDLHPSTTYYYRAAIQDGGSDIYGEVRSFRTSAASIYGEMDGLLELPALTGNEDFVKTYFSGSDRNYTMNYSYDKYAAMWVAYPLCSAHLSGSGNSNWKYNPDIDKKYQADIVSHSYFISYNAGSYARGHQIPNGSRKSDSVMNAQTYYVTNQTAQIQNGFNGTIWSAMENAVRGAVSGSDTLYVVTGPVYQTVGGNESISYLTGAYGINPNRLPLANYYFKAILKVKRSGAKVTSAIACGFWLEHKAYSISSFSNYAVSVDEIEARTGLDLFANLPDDIEAAAEINSSWNSFTSFK